MEFATKAEYVLFYMACISSGLFLIKIIMMFIGGDFEGDHDFSADAGDSDGDFGAFSINAIICFFMAFGWFGFASITEWGISFYPSMGIAFGAGTAASLFFSFSLGLAKKLAHEPTPPSVYKGDVGIVYRKIPSFGIGEVTVNNNNIKATSDELIDSFKRIQILEDKEIDTNTVVKVKEIKQP